MKKQTVIALQAKEREVQRSRKEKKEHHEFLRSLFLSSGANGERERERENKKKNEKKITGVQK